MQFGSSASVYNSAADPVSPEGSGDADPETVGWGSTTVGTLLRAKVSLLAHSLILGLIFQVHMLTLLFPPPIISVQSNDSGAWLWCSQDDWVIDAIRKVR